MQTRVSHYPQFSFSISSTTEPLGVSDTYSCEPDVLPVSQNSVKALKENHSIDLKQKKIAHWPYLSASTTVLP